MIEFVVRARKAPTDAERFLGKAGEAAHVQYLAQILVNTLFVSKGHRDDVCLTYVFEGSADYSRALFFRGDRLGVLQDQSEQGFLKLFAACLTAGARLGRDEEVETTEGIVIQATSFERLIKSYQATRPVFLLDRKGTDIRQATLPAEAVFLLTDHIPMPPKQRRSLIKRGVEMISLGPQMLHASQCVVLIQNEYDRL